MTCPLTCASTFPHLETLSDVALWSVARSHTDRQDQIRYSALLDKERDENLTETESAEFEQLYQAFNIHMLRKSYACVLLKWRGYALPSPAALD